MRALKAARWAALGRAKQFLQFSAQHSGDSDAGDAGDDDDTLVLESKLIPPVLSDDDDDDCDDDDEEHPLQLADVG